MDGVPIYKIAQKEKWNVLLVSMRAHDESEGNIFTLGVKERCDCVDWANWAAKHFGRETPIFLMGISMGGAVASRVSLEVQDLIEKLVLLSPAGNMPQIIDRYFASHEIDENGNIDMGGYYMNIAIKNAFNNYDMYKDIEKFKKPVLIMQGSNDKSVFPEYSKKYAELYENCQYVIVEGSEHCYTKVEYRKIVNETVKKFCKTKNN